MSNVLSIAKLKSQVNRMPKRLARARKTVVSLNKDAMRMAQRNPGRTVLGALAAGFVVSKLSRFV
jgi:hypothetical protein